ncbi:eukaryotic translation initiation factor 5A [Tanacetum coccineum]
MSDEEVHFDTKADAGASKTFPQQAGTIRKNAYIVIKNRPCKVVEVSTSKTGKHGHAKCHFVGIDIFTGRKLEDIVPSSHNCDVPHVTRTDYQLIDISEDGFVSLLTESGNTKDDLRLPTDEPLLSQIKDGLANGKDLVVTIMSAMGEEQINSLKDIGKNLLESCGSYGHHRYTQLKTYIIWFSGHIRLIRYVHMHMKNTQA